ncbi:MAG: FAD-dependent monooxygenase, partial [Blastocatellia bacterium]
MTVRPPEFDPALIRVYHDFMPRHKILISGAGIAGPTTAYWLLKHGFEPVLIERAPHLRQGGYIIDFWGIGFDVAERMGLVPTLRSLGYRMRKIEFVARDGRTRSSFGGNLFERALGDRFLSIHRGDLANAIYATIQNDVETIFGDSISGINQTSDGVEVTFEVGRPRCFDLVIGADGLHSPIRTLAFDLPATEHYLGYYAASFLTSGYSRRNENTYLSYAAPGRQISRYALRDDRTGFLFVFASEHRIPDVVHDIEAQKQVLRRTFSLEQWIEWPEIERHMDMCDDLYFDAVSQITLPC